MGGEGPFEAVRLILKQEPILEGLEVGGLMVVGGDGEEERRVEVFLKSADSREDMYEEDSVLGNF